MIQNIQTTLASMTDIHPLVGLIGGLMLILGVLSIIPFSVISFIRLVDPRRARDFEVDDNYKGFYGFITIWLGSSHLFLSLNSDHNVICGLAVGGIYTLTSLRLYLWKAKKRAEFNPEEYDQMVSKISKSIQKQYAFIAELEERKIDNSLGSYAEIMEDLKAINKLHSTPRLRLVNPEKES